ncbi:MAG: putative DNA binding domain-containing protein [Propionibacteriaceae bacterium]|jgi:ATP-dependent DNA helicase RecG|nr:putative DNA binding domain-containing protein [Propionibacteriaceae bacterium]
MSLQDEVNSVVERARLAGTDSVAVEIKRAAGGVPQSLPQTVSAFANGGGGLIVLGLDEASGFQPVPINAKSLAESLITACADRVEPAVRARVEVLEVDGAPVVAAAIPPLDPRQRPCHVKTQGLENGSYIRAHDGDRHLTSYEIHLLVSGRGQPQDDGLPVAGATLADLDRPALDRLVDRLRSRRGRAFQRAETADVLRMAGVCPRGGESGQVTLAGLLALGRYPQEFFPQLNVTFVAYPTADGRMMADGTRFLENVSLDGSIPEMVTGLVQTVSRNMTRRSVMVGVGREDHWEYPLEAIRELAANALLHRDYHPLAQGTQVRVEMYPDRLLFSNPGGLYGAATEAELLRGAASSSRNALLARLLEDVETPPSTRPVCENRGSGLKMVADEMAEADLEPPIFHLSAGTFTVELRNAPIGKPNQAPITGRAAVQEPNQDLLDALAAGPMTTTELMATVGLSRSAVSLRLRNLEERGLVSPTGPRFSRTVRWRLAT